MKTVIICNRLKPLQSAMSNNSGPLSFLNLLNTLNGIEIREHLKGNPQAETLPKAQLFRERRDGFRRKYVEFMGQINAENWSLHWWAMLFTSKNPFATDLPRNCFYALLIAEMMARDIESLVVTTDSLELASQVKAWGVKEGVKVVDLVRPRWTPRRFLKRHTPAGLIKAFLRTIVLWARSRRFRPQPNLTEDHLVIATTTHPASFSAHEEFRDPYFGPLIGQIASSRQKALILALVLERPIEQLRNIGSLKCQLPVVPVDACLNLRDLAGCLWHGIGGSLHPMGLRGAMEIDGMDLSVLVEQTVRETRRSGEYYLNLRMYYSARRLARTVKVSRCLFPFENRPWEKMLVQGVRAAAPEAWISGYQHASVTPGHTNFAMGSGEVEITPLPDQVLTTGDLMTNWLEQSGNFPTGMFKSACALRLGPSADSGLKSRSGKITRVLVALATSLEEYVDSLAFLEEAFDAGTGYEIRIRPHPIIPLELAVEISPPRRRDFYSQSSGALADDLSWSDVVLYASSTVGLEAVSLGIPAVHLDLGDFLDSDPMSGWQEFKWSVKKPSELIRTLETIDSITDQRFYEIQQRGREFVASYLKPPTEADYQLFWGTEQVRSEQVSTPV